LESIPEDAKEIRIAVDKQLREFRDKGIVVLTYPEEWVLDEEMSSDEEDEDFVHVYIFDISNNALWLLGSPPIYCQIFSQR